MDGAIVKDAARNLQVTGWRSWRVTCHRFDCVHLADFAGLYLIADVTHLRTETTK